MPVSAWDPTPYPDPRRRLPFAPSTEPGLPPALPVPRARHWNFHIEHAITNERRTVVSPRFQGPGVIRSLVFWAVWTATATRISQFELYVAPNGGGAGVTAQSAAPPSGSRLFDNSVSRSDSSTPFNSDALVWPNIAVDRIPVTVPLNVGVPDPEFFLKAALTLSITSTTAIVGVVQLWEGVAPESMFELVSG